MAENYLIGIPGQPWGKAERKEWLAAQTVKRSYSEQVVTKIETLKNVHDVVQYGALRYDQERYPLYVVKTRDWQEDKPVVLVTGGVHGYETSGVQGALRFAANKMSNYADQFNFIIAPCISPWGYETINRWNPNADDPNRSFYPDNIGPEYKVEESGHLMTYLKEQGFDFVAHFDLHETTDTDNTEFRPALAARDAKSQHSWNIPDGFYGVGDTLRPQPDFQAAIIKAVSEVTHIAPADENNQYIGSDAVQLGVINYAKKELGLCGGVTDAMYVTTTEVYPDSPKVNDENCIQAQVAVITGGLDYIIDKHNN